MPTVLLAGYNPKHFYFGCFDLYFLASLCGRPLRRTAASGILTDFHVFRYAFSYIEARQGMRKGDKIWQVCSHTLLLCEQSGQSHRQLPNLRVMGACV